MPCALGQGSTAAGQHCAYPFGAAAETVVAVTHGGFEATQKALAAEYRSWSRASVGIRLRWLAGRRATVPAPLVGTHGDPPPGMGK